MNSHDEQVNLMVRQLATLQQSLRAVRHAIDNNIAVLLAMAELSQRHLTHTTKLSQICLDKLPKISAAIGGFVELFDGTLASSRIGCSGHIHNAAAAPKPRRCLTQIIECF